MQLIIFYICLKYNINSEKSIIMRNLTLLFLSVLISSIALSQLPETYDLRDVNGENYVTSVKSQQGGTCWTHGSWASMEGNLLMTGAWADAGETGEPDLAEYHLDWWNGFNDHYNADIDPPSGSGLEVHQGGDYRVTTAYLSRGDGATREVDGSTYGSPPAYHDPSYHLFYPMRVEWYVAGENLENIDFLKEQIMEHGVMAVCMCWSSQFFNNGHNAHYQPASTTLEPNHSVSIIGWDDNFDKNNFNTSPPENGAWLTKNSWGSGWGDDGYFWISYYDKQACQNPEMGAISFLDVVPMPYNNAYYHDYHGWRDTLLITDKAFNKFVAEATETINAVSFFTAENNVDFTATIYDDFNGTDLQNELSSITGTIEYSGLHTQITTPYEIESGDDFYLYVEFSDGGHPYDRTSDVPVLLGGSSKTIVTSTANPDESYYWENGQWNDFYEYDDPSGFQESGNFCLKVLTTITQDIDLGNVDINDPSGNNNGRLDPGETADIDIELNNIGLYEVTDINAVFTSSDPYLIINNGTLNFGNIPAGESGTASINISVDSNTPINHIIAGMLNVECQSNGGTYTYEYDLSFKVGVIVEDFETGDFTAYDWSFDGDADWTISSSDVYEGSYCAKSGNIGNSSETELILTLDVIADGEISFYRKISTESGYDYLYFYIDGSEAGLWAGEVDWGMETYSVSAGSHTFKWSYVKDTYETGGDDCVWIDWIELPAIEDPGLPVTFDLRDYNGENYVSSVKSQTGGTCWTHGTLASMEGNLIMNGNWANTNDDPEPNLAEYHLDWWNGFNDFFNEDVDPPTGTGLEIHMGGDYRVSTAYMSRGEGMVYSPDANDNTEKDDVWYDSAPDRFDTNYSMYYSRDVEWYIVGGQLENIDFIKEKIMEQGVLAICMCWNNLFFNNEYNAHYQPASSQSDPNHSIAVIGWDDNFDKNNFNTPPPENGAWLTKNSWGSDFGEDGYFWTSYYDKWAGQHPEMGAVSFINTEPWQYDNVYYHDYHGWRDTKTDITEAFNAFTITGIETVEAVNFFTSVHDVDFTIKIYDNYDGTELSDELASKSGHINYSGLHTIDLDSPVEFTQGDDFYVYLFLSEGGHPYDRTSIVPVLLCGNDSKTLVPSSASPEESYYNDGAGWVDFYYYDDPSGHQNTGNFCIKAITTGDPMTSIGDTPDTYNSDMSQNYPNPFATETTISYYLSENSDIRLSVFDIMGREIAILVNDLQVQGQHNVSWNGKIYNGEKAEPGMYIYKLEVNGRVAAARRMLKVN